MYISTAVFGPAMRILPRRLGAVETSERVIQYCKIGHMFERQTYRGFSVAGLCTHTPFGTLAKHSLYPGTNDAMVVCNEYP